MKHIKNLSRPVPQRATLLEELLCSLATILNTVVLAVGGETPLTQFLADKCAFTPQE